VKIVENLLNIRMLYRVFMEFFPLKKFLIRYKIHGFKNYLDYQKRHHIINPKFPPNPIEYYDIPLNFLLAHTRKDISKDFYSWEDFVLKFKEYAFESRTDYRKRYKIDPKLPSTPNKYYYEEWISWSSLTNNPCGRISKDYYPFEEFLIKYSEYNFIGIKDYKKRYKIDPKLPSHPEEVYWTSWSDLRRKSQDSKILEKLDIFLSFFRHQL
jgi:hypothetical protein